MRFADTHTSIFPEQKLDLLDAICGNHVCVAESVLTVTCGVHVADQNRTKSYTKSISYFQPRFLCNVYTNLYFEFDFLTCIVIVQNLC